MQKSILITGKVKILPMAEIGMVSFSELLPKMRPSLFLNDLYYAAIVKEVERPLRPESTARATFLMATDEIVKAGGGEGSQIEIRGGTTTIGEIVIEEIKPIYVRWEPSSVDGYTLVDVDE